MSSGARRPRGKRDGKVREKSAAAAPSPQAPGAAAPGGKRRPRPLLDWDPEVPPRGGALLHLPLRDAAGAAASCTVALRHIAGGSCSAFIVHANLPPAVTESACIKLLRRLTHSQTAVQVRELQREGPPGLRGVPTARHHP